MSKIEKTQNSGIVYDSTKSQTEQTAKAIEIGKIILETYQESDTGNNTFYGEALSLSKNNKSKNKTYQMGQRRENTRIIGTSQVLEDGFGSGTVNLNLNGRILTLPSGNSDVTPYADTTDGYIGDSKQNRRGDCYFLAEINAIRNTKNGQAMLTQNCKKNDNGSYTITLPGAQKIRKEYTKKGLKCEVTGTYIISKEALDKAGKSTKYSKGDLEVVAFELAMEAFRAEMYITNKQNGNTQYNDFTAEGQTISFGKGKKGDILSGGQTWDAGFILTGQKSDVYFGYDDKKHMQNLKLYNDGKYGYITREEMAQRTGADISMYSAKAITNSEISHLSKKEQSINQMLDKYTGKEGEYAITFGVKVASKGPDGATVAGGGHALTVVKITDDTVYVSNPWHPDKIEPIPRNDFIKMCTSLQAMPTGTTSSAPTQEQHSNLRINDLVRFIQRYNK
ncbi:MAG: hypothetical protein ACI4S3_09660 [Candidatus Gastranaerophilaceae bacterium]